MVMSVSDVPQITSPSYVNISRNVIILLLLLTLAIVKSNQVVKNDISTQRARRCPCELPDNSWNATNSLYAKSNQLLKKPIAINICCEPSLHKSLNLSFWTSYKLLIGRTIIYAAFLESILIESNCDVYIENKKIVLKRLRCPGGCLPTPIISLDLNIINFNHSQNFLEDAILCSLTKGMLHSVTEVSTASHEYIPIVLSLLALRRINECRETPLQGPISLLPRRKIKLLVLYMGSKKRLELMLRQQVVFQHLPIHGNDAVLAWMATEELYPCRPGTFICTMGKIQDSSSNRMVYLPGYPYTDLYENASRWAGATVADFAGWACAQRRPLRSLAHVLYLYDPQLLIAVDDDTFLNWPVMETLIDYFIGADGEYPTVFSSNAEKTLLGGGGMILGRNGLTRLTENRLFTHRDTRLTSSRQLVPEALEKSKSCSPTFAMPPSDHTEPSSTKGEGRAQRFSQTMEGTNMTIDGGDLLVNFDLTATVAKSTGTLASKSVLRGGGKDAAGNTTGGGRVKPSVCVSEKGEEDVAAHAIGTRLIDMCVSLLSGEHTCFHRYAGAEAPIQMLLNTSY